MKDWFFFPFAALIIAGIIWYALSLGERVQERTEADIVANGYVLSGPDLAILTASPGTKLTLPQTGDALAEYAILSAHISQAESPPSLGVFATLGADFEKAFGGRKLRVSFSARAGQDRPAATFKAVYFAVEGRNSPWSVFDLTPDFETYAFEFSPKAHQGEPSVDYIGIWPAPEGGNQSIEIECIKVEVLN